MKIAYVTTYDASSVRNWSGLGYYIARALEQQALQLHYIGSLAEPWQWFFRGKALLYRYALKKRLLHDREPHVLKSYARQVAARLKGVDVEVVFSPGTLPICYLDCDRPIAFWTDATFAGLVGFYARFSNLCRETLKSGNEMEQTALTRCRLAIYSSDWAARTACAAYEVDPAKVKVVPFGANIECDRSLEDVKAIVSTRPRDKCKLLFIGLDWYRKGGDVAVQIAEELNRQGLPTELTVVGAAPPGVGLDFVFPHGFVSKADKDGYQTLNRLFAESHFLVVPTKSDTFLLVVAEANSFGVPAVTNAVGGVATTVRNGLNGWAFAVDSGVSEYCSYISDLMSDPPRYQQLALSSFDEYQTRLNWQVTGRTVKELILENCI